MATIEFRTRDDTPPVALRDRVGKSAVGKHIAESELDNEVRVFFPGGPESLQMFEIWVEPHCGPDPHAHHEAEIIYVVEGEVRFGGRVLVAGESVHIPAYTLYSFKAGPEGLRFLNFRARANGVYISKAELMEMRAEGRLPPG